VPENDPSALAEAIRRLSTQPELGRQFSVVGRERFAAEFTIPAYARKIAQGLQLKEHVHE